MTLIKKTKAQYTKVKQLRLTSPLISRILIGLILLFIVSLFVKIKLVIFLVVVIFTNITMENFRLRANLPADFELSTFSTVLVTIAFGWKWGLVTAIFSKLITSIATGNILADHFFMIMMYIHASIWASVFRTVNVFGLGMVIVTVNCIIFWFISKNVLGLDVTSNLSYTSTNFVGNFLVFSIFSEIVLKLLI